MRILFVVSDANCNGGTEILARLLLSELNNSDFECWLLSRFPYRGNNPKILSLDEDDFIKWDKSNKRLFNKLSGSYKSDKIFADGCFRIARRIGAEWIINHTYDLIGAMPYNKGIKIAQIFNWSINGYETNLIHKINEKKGISYIFSRLAFFYLSYRWHKSISNLDMAVILTSSAKTEITKYLNSDSKISIIPDPLAFNSDSKFISNLHNNNLVFVGRLSHEKGVMRLLRIWQLVYKKLPLHELLIFGEGSAKDEMLCYINNNNLPRVRFKGFSTDLKNIYGNADICIMTSDTEGFGMVLIEAMYYGVPCISFDCPISPKEVIGKAGRTVPCFDERSYASTIVEMLNAPQSLAEMQSAAIIQARNYYIGNIINLWKNALLNRQ